MNIKGRDNRRNVRFELTPKMSLDVWEERTCPICGKKFYARKKYKKITCSEECYWKYYDEHRSEINEKRSKSMFEANSHKTREQKQAELMKRRETCLKRYGYDMKHKTPEYREWFSQKMKQIDWSQRSAKVKESLKKKYSEICEKDNLELVDFRGRFDATVKCKKCGNVFDVHVLGYLSEYANHNLCRKCHPNANSLKNTEPSNFIKGILDLAGVSYEVGNREAIPPYEIDIFIPSENVGIEVNGNYWHSELGGGRGKYYHINKTERAFDSGIKLIHVFEDEIVSKPEIVKSRILNVVGKTEKNIYARNCSVSEVGFTEKHSFFEENHIDGDSASKYNIALIHDGEIVSIASFGKRSLGKSSSFELIKFCLKNNTNVIGGFSKILKYFIEKYDPEAITTYSDIRWSGIDHEKSFYALNGFKYIKQTTPNYFYVDRKNYLKRLNRLNFTKKKLIKEGFNPSETETKIMLERGFDRIWDCGSMKFEYKKSRP